MSAVFTNSKKQFVMEIKTVDYLDYISGDPKRKASFIKQLGDAFSEIGFAIVANHGVSEDLKSRLFDVVDRYFQQPEDVKLKDEDLNNGGQRGFISKGRETAKGHSVPDLKEFYHVGQEVTDGDPIKSEYPDNIWPTAIPEFQEITMEVFRTFEKTGRDLLRAIAVYLDLEENYFDNKIHNGNSILRLLHYYPVENADQIPAGAVRAGAHEDINLITLLMGGSARGLQALKKDGEWLNVSPEPGQIVINMGDMLQRLTNGRLRSTTHRVITLSGDDYKKPRFSTPFFLHPRSDMDLTCLPSCISEENPKQFSDMTAGQYLEERILELGLK
jgi:isopenicillin N synthase-like dioxygenase